MVRPAHLVIFSVNWYQQGLHVFEETERVREREKEFIQLFRHEYRTGYIYYSDTNIFEEN